MVCVISVKSDLPLYADQLGACSIKKNYSDNVVVGSKGARKCTDNNAQSARKEKGNRRQETDNRKQRTRNRQKQTDNKKQTTRNRQQVTDNRKQQRAKALKKIFGRMPQEERGRRESHQPQCICPRGEGGNKKKNHVNKMRLFRIF